jgi:ComF family protein
LKYANPAVRELIHALKYGGLRAAAEPLVSVLAEYLSASLKNHPNFAGNSIIIPIPLHPGKERERGFNQALIIAEGLKDRMENFQETPLVSGCLFKKESTGSQTEQKDCAAREENVRGSFGLRDMELISGRNVFLIDDVFTSGATMREAARILKSAGAKKIVAVTVARA